MNSYSRVRSILMIFVLVSCLLAGKASGYQEKPAEAGDTLAASDTLRKAEEINITPDRIDIKYSNGTDTLILRPGGSEKGKSIITSQDALIKIGEDQLIDVLDSVRSSVVVFFGDLEIRGYVKGNILDGFGDVRIRPGASVEGNITCLGEVYVDTGTHIWGNISAFDLHVPVNSTSYDFKGTYEKIFFRVSELKLLGPPAMMAMIGFLLAIIVLVIVITAILPRPVARVRYQIETGFMKCLLVGVLLTIAIFPLWLLIIVTIIGIPIALLIYPFVVIGAYVLGAIGFTQYAGFELGRRTTLRYHGYMRTTLAGVILLGSPLILATFFGFVNLFPLAWPLQAIYLGVQFLMFSTGLGAVFFSRFGMRPRELNLDPVYKMGVPPEAPGGSGIEPQD